MKRFTLAIAAVLLAVSNCNAHPYCGYGVRHYYPQRAACFTYRSSRVACGYYCPPRPRYYASRCYTRPVCYSPCRPRCPAFDEVTLRGVLQDAATGVVTFQSIETLNGDLTSEIGAPANGVFRYVSTGEYCGVKRIKFQYFSASRSKMVTSNVYAKVVKNDFGTNEEAEVQPTFDEPAIEPTQRFPRTRPSARRSVASLHQYDYSTKTWRMGEVSHYRVKDNGDIEDVKEWIALRLASYFN